MSNKNVQLYLCIFTIFTTTFYAKGDDLDDMDDSLIPPNINFVLFTREQRSGVAIPSVSSLVDTSFDKTKPTKIVTHGWRSNGNSTSCMEIKDGFLTAYDANVIVLNWDSIARTILYHLSRKQVPVVAEVLQTFLNDLFTKVKVNASDIHMVGHSLGAHVIGIAGEHFQNPKIGRVTGLDPALPLFTRSSDKKISSESAEFVDIIHTCAGFLGIKGSLGHADFYPNGGSVYQPGCFELPVRTVACAHTRSWTYFMESLHHPGIPFLAYACKSYASFRRGRCGRYAHPVKMGDPTPKTARGKYFLRTGSRPPYGLGAIGLDAH